MEEDVDKLEMEDEVVEANGSGNEARNGRGGSWAPVVGRLRPRVSLRAEFKSNNNGGFHLSFSSS